MPAPDVSKGWRSPLGLVAFLLAGCRCDAPPEHLAASSASARSPEDDAFVLMYGEYLHLERVEKLREAPAGWPEGSYRILEVTARRPAHFSIRSRAERMHVGRGHEVFERTDEVRILPAGSPRHDPAINTQICVGDRLRIPIGMDAPWHRVLSFRWEPAEVHDHGRDDEHRGRPGPCRWDAAWEIASLSRFAPQLVQPIAECSWDVDHPGTSVWETLFFRLTANAPGEVPGQRYRVLGPNDTLLVTIGHWGGHVTYADGSVGSGESGRIEGLKMPLRPGDTVWIHGTGRTFWSRPD